MCSSVFLILVNFLLYLLFLSSISYVSIKSRVSNNKLVFLKRKNKTVIVGLICFLSNFLSMFVSPMIFIQLDKTALPIIFNLYLTLNHFASVCYFDHWKQLMWPWYDKKKKIDAVKNQHKVSMLSCDNKTTRYDFAKRSDVDLYIHYPRHQNFTKRTLNVC